MLFCQPYTQQRPHTLIGVNSQLPFLAGSGNASDVYLTALFLITRKTWTKCGYKHGNHCNHQIQIQLASGLVHI